MKDNIAAVVGVSIVNPSQNQKYNYKRSKFKHTNFDAPYTIYIQTAKTRTYLDEISKKKKLDRNLITSRIISQLSPC